MDALLQSLLLSGCLGALIGLERQWDEQFHNPKGRVPAGVRTFTLWALTGTLCAHFSKEFHAFVFGAGLFGIMIFMAVFLTSRARQQRNGTGFTTAAVAVLTYLLGGLVYIEEEKTAVVIAIAVIILLAGKPYLHSVSRKFSEEDVRMALQFAAVTGIVLPLVPNESFGPYGAFNPRSIWLMVVLVSSVGFIGYLAVRIAGAKLGIALTGLLGGLASSTATTLAMSRSSRSQPEYSSDYSLAIILACTVMLWRVLVLIAVFSVPLAWGLVPSMLLMSLPGIAFAVFHLLSKRPGESVTHTQGSYKNPLSLKVAIQFALLYALIVFAVKATGQSFGDAGVYVVSFLSGLTDLDAIALTLSQTAAAGTTPIPAAAAGIVIAGCANSLLKAGLALSLGSPELRMRVAVVLGATVAIGAGCGLWLALGR